jgi:glycosyltransferase involved in cell wall biosynthesis
MFEVPIDPRENHAAFLASPRKHVLMITNHGIHQWEVVPGLPDTGGQNVFVNQFTHALAKFGFRITIVNRGGYAHPVDAQIPALVESLRNFLDAEGLGIDLILSHYWDAAKIGVLYNRSRPARAKHVWVPHSLGAIKKRNVSPEQWAELRIDERIANEKRLIPELDGIAATSSTIRGALRKDYGYATPSLFLPPCVDADRYHQRDVPDEDGVWDFLSQRSGTSPQEVRGRKIVTEISRTDTTKRKDVLIRKNWPETSKA